MSIIGARPVTILYTASLSGQLTLLPTLFTRIQMEKSRASGPTLLVDMGRSCAPDTWICTATRGIGMLVAMDAMGYDAFHIGPADSLYSQPGPVQHLRKTILTPLAAGPWTATLRRADIGVMFTPRGSAEQTASTLSLAERGEQDAQGGNKSATQKISVLFDDEIDLLVTLALTDTGRVAVGWRDEPTPCRTLLLDAGKDALLLGRLDIALLPDPPYIRLLSQERIHLPQEVEGLSPHPSIMSVVEFVQSEARYTERKRTEP